MTYKEDYPLIPKYPYYTSKARPDTIAQSYTSIVHELLVVITRYSYIFCVGKLNFSALIPDAIRSALGYSKFIPRGDGSITRNFLCIEDFDHRTCSGVVLRHNLHSASPRICLPEGSNGLCKPLCTVLGSICDHGYDDISLIR